jgi:ATP/maltotriose-dependent transcriptional regulator MalT/DNA-binding SARP family transcriptional activator
VAGRSPLQPSTIGRPALERHLDAALRERRLTCVVAGPGFGKTTLLSHWAETTPHAMSAWHGMTGGDRTLSALVRAVTDALRLCVPALPADLVTAVAGARGPDTGTEEAGRANAYAGRICAAVAEARPRPLVLVLDDVEMLEGAPEATSFLAGLCRQAAPPLHVVVASRGDVPFPVARLRGQGLLAEVSAADLAFTPDETAAVLGTALGDDDDRLAALAADVHEVTAGWPAAVRLAGEALARVPPGERRAALDRLCRPGGVVHDYLVDEVVAGEPEAARDLLVRLAVLDHFTPELAEAIGPGGSAVLPGLVRRGLVVDAPGRGQSWLRVNALLREVVAAAAAPAVRTETLDAAGRWLAAHDQPAAAVRCALAAGAGADASRLVAERGRELLGSGEADVLLEAIAGVPAAERAPTLWRLDGDARQLVGDWDGAAASYERAAGDPAGALPAGLAWRWGLIHHLRGDLDAALDVYGRGAVGDDDELADQALLTCWTATAHWLRGDADRCRELADDAMTRARRSGDDRALAAAHTVQALVAAQDGDRLANDTNYLRALDHAERAGDVLQIIRIRLNRGSRLSEEGFHAEAIAELDLAIGLADLGGYGSFKAIALCNRGEARGALGLFDEALDDVQGSKAIFQRMGSLTVAYPLGQAADLHAARGQTALAYAAYTEAIEVARRSGDRQGLVPALAGLARLIAADDPERARRLVDEAVDAAGTGLAECSALLAAAWVAHATGDLDGAAAVADRVGPIARDRRDRPALAELAELRGALAGDDDVAAQAALLDALAAWDELGDPLGQGRALLALARRDGPDATDLARRAERVLRPLGARRLATAAAELASAAPAPPRLAVHCLGGFAVLRDGVPVPVGEWKSRKARDLVKIVIARGGPVHREALRDVLWPDDEPAQTASKLSVALSTARAVLDPGKEHPPGWFLGADNDTVWIDSAHVAVDVDRFHDLAARAVTERKGGPSAAATDALVAAEAAYVGAAFPEDPYEDWSVSPRERTRAAYIWVARTLADDSAAGDPATAVRCYLRVLELDAYDERAHLGLVRAHLGAGQQGEARRAYQAYAARMGEIGVEAAPFPAPGSAARS